MFCVLGVLMKKTVSILTIAGGLLLTSSIQAADVIYPDYDLPVAPVAGGFDWDGFYAGVGVSGSVWGGGARSIGGSLSVGANATFDNFLVGVEGSAHYGYSNATNDWGYVLGLEGRAGYLAAPEVLVYLSGGAAYLDPAPSDWYATVGGGVEFAVTDQMSVDVQYRYLWASTSSANSVGASVLWHF